MSNQFAWFVMCVLAGNLFCPSASESYVIVGVSIGPVSNFLRDFKPTFEVYLSDQVSKILGRNISFSLTGVSLNAESDTIFDLVESRRVDFVYSAPYIMGCLESEFDLQLLATIRKRYVVENQEYILNRYNLLPFTIFVKIMMIKKIRYGGVILVR